MPPRSPELLVPTVAAWRSWLAKESFTQPVIWLIVARKNSTTPEITYTTALEEALCYGWIDSGGCSRDETTRFIRFGPRKEKSPWSRRNIGYIEKLEREGRMASPGLDAVRKAKVNGMWDAAYAAGEVPLDLRQELEGNARAKVVWDGLSRKDQYAVIVKLGTLPLPSKAREKRIKAVIEGLLVQRSAAPGNVLVSGQDVDKEPTPTILAVPSTRSSARLRAARRAVD